MVVIVVVACMGELQASECCHHSHRCHSCCYRLIITTVITTIITVIIATIVATVRLLR
jgi:hypothetical protein